MYMYMYIYIYIYIYTHTHTHTYITEAERQGRRHDNRAVASVWSVLMSSIRKHDSYLYICMYVCTYIYIYIYITCIKRGGGYCRPTYCCLELLDSELSNFNKWIGSTSSNWKIWVRWALPTVLSPLPNGQFSWVRFATITIEGLKSQNHCLTSLQNAPWKFKSPRGWAPSSRLSVWTLAVPPWVYHGGWSLRARSSRGVLKREGDTVDWDVGSNWELFA